LLPCESCVLYQICNICELETYQYAFFCFSLYDNYDEHIFRKLDE
jgi:hypothetical protein